MSNRELCHSTSKPIGNNEDTLISFMTFDITSHKSVFRVVIGSQIIVLNIRIFLTPLIKFMVPLYKQSKIQLSGLIL